LAVDPADSAVVWAGTGKASSSGMGGKTVGLMRSSDHGRTWRVFDARLGSAGRSVNAILPMIVNGDNGRVVLVGSTATRFGKGRNQLGGGLLRSTDSVNGAFMKISGNANDGIDNDGDGKIDQDDLDVNKWGWLGEDTGLPAGTVTDLEVDPTFPRRVYAAVAGQGVFRSDDTGLTWRNVSAGLPNVGMAARIELSVGGAPPNGSPSVYAA